MKNKRTLVTGASENPDRYSNKAAKMLMAHGHEVVLHGLKPGEVNGTAITTQWPGSEKFDTVTLYIGPQNQPGYYDPIIDLKPDRVIFNPGTENAEFAQKLDAAGIKYENACTLVLLSTGQY